MSDTVTTLRGLAVTRGSVTGRVRIVAGNDNEFERGEILVTSMTTPDMLDLMAKASGFITELGGRTCHAAVVARAMGKPCVVGVRDIMRHVRTGMTVTVHGERGEVEVHG